MKMPILEKMAMAVQNGNAPETKRFVAEALSLGLEPWDILNKGMVPALDILGEQLKDYSISLPEVMVSVGAVRAGLGILQPLLYQGSNTCKGVVVIGTVQGDVHSLGKDVVVMMLEGNGFQVIDLGTDVPASRFMKACREHNAGVVAMSGLISISKITMGRIVKAFEDAGIRDGISFMVGGGSVDEESAREIGADDYGEDASLAPEMALRALKKGHEGDGYRGTGGPKNRIRTQKR